MKRDKSKAPTTTLATRAVKKGHLGTRAVEEGQLATRTMEKGYLHLDASSGALEESGSNPQTVAMQRKSKFMSFYRRVAQAKAINNHTHQTRFRSMKHWSEERRWHGYTRRGLKVRHERIKVLQPLLLGLPP